MVATLSTPRCHVAARRGAVVEGGQSSGFGRLSQLWRCQSLRLDHVSPPRSSNPPCGSRALRSHSKPCLRSCEAALQPRQTRLPDALLVRVTHMLPVWPLLLAQAPERPLGRVRIEHPLRQTDLAQAEVMRPASSAPFWRSRVAPSAGTPRRARVNSLIMRRMLRTLFSIEGGLGLLAQLPAVVVPHTVRETFQRFRRHLQAMRRASRARTTSRRRSVITASMASGGAQPQTKQAFA